VTVFEADANASVRDQGGTLDLHADSGQVALDLAGLAEGFRANARFEDQQDRVLAHDSAATLFDERPADGKGERPEIDRRALRDLLLGALRPGTVRWGKKLDRIEAAGGAQRLVFTDGAAEVFDFVIGADGAWSKVRAALTNVKPVYTGVTFFECWIDDVDAQHPELAALLGRGTMFVVHGKKGLVAQRNANGHVRVYVNVHMPEEWGADLLRKSSTAAAKVELLARFRGWAPGLLAFVERSADLLVSRPIYALPAPFNWTPQPGLTVVGDAAHLMPPMGLGVNLAMQDAAELAVALSSGPSWPAAVRAHEEAMMARANVIAPEAALGFDEMYGEDATANILRHMTERSAQ
jgi:2-polyprenyl-6-methoxyphenol hydroxylase-like FAD-dependent oxidoreductase